MSPRVSTPELYTLFGEWQLRQGPYSSLRRSAALSKQPDQSSGEINGGREGAKAFCPHRCQRGRTYPFGSFRRARQNGKLRSLNDYERLFKASPGIRASNIPGLPSTACRDHRYLGIGVILFLLLLFAALVGSDITQDDPDEQDVKTGFNGI
jgi:hypothetical protein